MEKLQERAQEILGDMNYEINKLLVYSPMSNSQISKLAGYDIPGGSFQQFITWSFIHENSNYFIANTKNIVLTWDRHSELCSSDEFYSSMQYYLSQLVDVVRDFVILFPGLAYKSGIARKLKLNLTTNHSTQMAGNIVDIMLYQKILQFSHFDEGKKIYTLGQNDRMYYMSCELNFCRSIGESLVARFLEKNNIRFEHQKRFSNCRYKRTLPFDFYLNDYEILIEVHGIQHYKYVEYFHQTIEKFEEQKMRDEIKKNFAKNQDIPLIILDASAPNKIDFMKTIQIIG